MKALISGSHGFIGSHLKQALEDRGWQVTGIPRLMFYDAIKLAEFYKKEEPDFIFHLAAYGNMAGQDDVTQIFNANILGSLAMLSSALTVPFKGFINVSTSSVLLPHETFYSASKASAERVAKVFIDEFQKPVVTIRPFSVYGPGEADFRFIPTVFRSCLDNEEMTLSPSSFHDWIYIDDLVNALILSTQKIDKIVGKSLNIGTGNSESNETVVDYIQSITGKKANIKEIKSLRTFDTTKWVADNQEAKDLLGWEPEIVLHEGLRRIYNSLTKN